MGLTIRIWLELSDWLFEMLMTFGRFVELALIFSIFSMICLVVMFWDWGIRFPLFEHFLGKRRFYVNDFAIYYL